MNERGQIAKKLGETGGIPGEDGELDLKFAVTKFEFVKCSKYAGDLKNKCKMSPDMDLLTKVTIGCGPAVYSADSETVAASQPAELELVKNNFLIKKLGLKDGPQLMAAINAVIETYGKSERNKYRAVVYYMLTKHFGKDSVYN